MIDRIASMTQISQIGDRHPGRQIARRKITVNAVAPGFCATDMTEAVRNAAPELAKSIPLKRLGEPQDIASAVLFLASDEASYITGQVLTVDGGLTLGVVV